MGKPWRSRRMRVLVATLMVGVAATAASVSVASYLRAGEVAFSLGTYDRGTMTVPLYRGAAVPFELTVIATPDNCAGTLTLTLSWDEEENWVRLHLTGTNVLEPHPSVDRTEGVNYLPNPFWPEPEDIVDGRYQFWIITPSEELTFYYDPVTLDLLGSEKDFETPPPAIPIKVPALLGVGSPFFQPDANGDVDFTWTFAYDQVVRGDRPELGHHYFTFPPTNLCEANPFRYDLTTARGYISAPQDPSEARTWGDYLSAGLVFDTTVEPGEYASEPPLTTMTATYSNTTLFGGAVPRGWIMDFDHIFGNLAPGITPWESRDSCEDWYRPPHTPHINFCAAQAGGDQ